MDGLAGTNLGRYELIGTLGTGGMATVYLARTAGEAGFQRMFAVKVLHPHLASDTGFVKMLLDEARIAALLHHPNVVPIVDLGTHAGTHYVAMEYIEGCSLSALLRKQRDDRPVRLLVPLAIDALAGLDAAHELTDEEGKSLNLVHRDVSPQNVLVGIDGTARITDFGIARAESRIQSTRPGQLKGKIAYMSPEQIRAGALDRRSDVFSAGAMLWSMLTARRLFQADNDAATMSNILEMTIVPPSTVGQKPPEVFDAICLRALERDPDKRFSTAREMEEALREAATTAGLLGSRREISTWLGAVFKDELGARRSSVRAAVSGAPLRNSLNVTAEFPSFTPSVPSLMSDVARDAPTRSAESTPRAMSVPDHGFVEITHVKPRRTGIVVALTALIVGGLGIGGYTMMSSSDAPVATAASEQTPAVALPAASTPEPARGASPDVAVKLYLDEAEQLLANRRIDAAQALIDRARAANAVDPSLVVRLTRLGEQAHDASLRTQALRAIAAKDKSATIETAQQILERNPDDAEAKQWIAAARGPATPAPQTGKAVARGQLTIDAPAGASVFVDDDLIGRGAIEKRALPIGEHVVVVRKDGFAPARRSVRISSNKVTRVAVELTKPAPTATPPKVATAEPTSAPPVVTAPPPVAKVEPPSVPVVVAKTQAAPPVAPVANPKPSVAAPPAAPTPTEIAAPRLPGSYSASNMKELGKVLSVIEGEAISRGGAPASIRGITNALAEEAFGSFAPGARMDVKPSAIYYAIVRGLLAGKSAATISAELRTGHAQGKY